MTGAPAPDLAEAAPAIAAAWLCAVDPVGLGGIALRERAGPARDRWLKNLRALLPPATPVRRLPLHADDQRVFGGLDLTATLAAGRPVAERGVLAETDGGLLVLSMAERVPSAMAARLGAVLDTGTVTLERDGLGQRLPARIGIVALDEGIEADEHCPPALLDRLAFWVDLDGVDPAAADNGSMAIVAEARERGRQVEVGDDITRALCETAMALGVGSLRASLLAIRAAKAAAALAGRDAVADADARLAARLVLAPRATRLPADAADETDPAQEDGESKPEPPPDAPPTDEARAQEAIGDVVLAAAKAAIPPGLLDRLRAEAAPRGARPAPGRTGAQKASVARGRPAGLRAGKPVGGARLDVIATLRAAAPWQRLRAAPDGEAGRRRRVQIRRDDLRIVRFKQHSETVTIFVVDGSGSLALNRLAEAKGAVELLLAECYVRRDQVALLAFRGTKTDLLLPPTRSLTRAKRCLAGLPGGGGTPLAGAIDAAMALAGAVRRRGQTPVVVMLTDGRANVARDGTTGRAQAEADARDAALAAGASGLRMVVIDASPRPQHAKSLAEAMQARYLALPRADAGALSRAVLAATAS